MTRNSLSFVRITALPRGFYLRPYQPGDKENWVRIHTHAEPGFRITLETFDEQFAAEQSVLTERQFFVAREDGVAVGTATAWFDRHFDDPAWGRVHYVAVLPEFQKQGLGAALVTAVCARLRDLGHQRAYLITWSDRPWAVRLYERLGFEMHPGWQPT